MTDHKWDEWGERCVNCGDKDWFARPQCRLTKKSPYNEMTDKEEKILKDEFESLYPRRFMPTNEKARETVLPHMLRGYLLGLRVARDTRSQIDSIDISNIP